MNQADDILGLARHQIGVKESPSGSNNVIYNTRYYGQEVHDGLWGTTFAWCAVFVWWLFRELGLSKLYYGGKKTASCTTLCNYYKANGQIVPFDQAKPGDIVFFKWKTTRKTPQHVGIVESRKEDTLTTIEGNTAVGNDGNGGMVMRRKRKSNVVFAVARPAYKNNEEEIDMTKEDVQKIVKEEVEKAVSELKPIVYKTAADIPAWAANTVESLINQGKLIGDQNGNLNLSQDTLRSLVIMNR